jgi:hypothetical protein
MRITGRIGKLPDRRERKDLPKFRTDKADNNPKWLGIVPTRELRASSIQRIFLVHGGRGFQNIV